MSEPIVVGTDGSGESERAVEWAAAEAELRGRPLHIVHAVPKPPLFASAEKTERLRRAGKAVVEKAGEHLRERWPEVETSTAVVADSAADALRREASGAFELVLGERGRGGFARMLLGSTSLQMASRCSVPVVIVRGDVQDRGEVQHRGEVVAGVDLGRETDAVLGYAFDAARLRGARLRVVHAWQLPTTLVDAGYTVEDEDARPELRVRLSEACARLRSEHPEVECVEDVVLEHPVKALTSRSRGASLLVVGAPERRWNAPRLGSTSHGVAHHAQAPVAVVPVKR